MPNQIINKKNHPEYTVFCRDRKAFTLIEVMAVIAIIGILAIVSWSSLGSSKRNVQVDSACNQAAAMINKARGYALSGKVVSGKTPQNFSVTLSGSDVIIKADGALMETMKLAGGVQCSGAYSFSLPTGTCSGCGSMGNCWVSGTAYQKKINVTKFSAKCE